MALKAVKLPDNTTVQINDSRIPGVDTTPTSGSGNVITSGGVYSSSVTALGTSGNNLTWTKNGATNNITVPYATSSGTASKLGSATVGSSERPIYLNAGTATQVSTINGNIISGKISDSASSYLVSHPERSTVGVLVPFLNNDIAFLMQQGGHVTIYSTTDTDLTKETLTVKHLWGSDNTYAAIFDGSPLYYNFGNQTAEEMAEDGIIIDITLPRTFSYSNKFYIDFGSGWGFSTVEVLVKLSAYETAYVSKISNTSTENRNLFYSPLSHSVNDGGTTRYGFDMIRIHLVGSPNTTAGRRIAQIGLVNYSSQGNRYVSMSRGLNDRVWRTISPFTTNTYALGESSYRWSTVYGVNANFSGTGTISGNTTIGGTLGVTGNITGASFIKSGGTSSQFLKADGSVDSNTYAKTSQLPAAPGTLNTTATTAQSTSASEALSGSVTLHKVAKTGTYSDLIGTPTVPTSLSQLSADTTHRTVTDAQINAWNSKQDALASDAIAYIGAQQGSATYVDGGQVVDVTTKADKVSSATSGNFAGLDSNGNLTDSGHKHSDYQAALVSGTNIKTINSTSLLGSGNIAITVPTISTSITSDASSDTKTASPKAVKTYVDGVVGDIETLLAAI